MPEKIIENHINDVLTKKARMSALAFIAFLRENEMQFERGKGYWEDKRYWMIKYKSEYVCFILINGYGSVRHQDEPEGWVVWSDASDFSTSQWYENDFLDEQMKQIAWQNVDYCANCSPGSSCYGGVSKTIFEKEYNNVCRTTFRFDNTDIESLECIKKMLEIKKSDILKNNSKKKSTNAADVPSISLFDSMISELPQALKDEIVKTDKHLKTMRPLKFKRSIDKKAKKITYVASDYGVSYMFKISADTLTHNFQWYIVYNGKPETWHRRADYMEETLEFIAKSDFPLSMRIYNALKSCPGSDNCYGERCLARTPYAFNGQKRLTCHGSVILGINPNDFNDARNFFNYLNELVNEKTNNGEPLPEKIILCKTKRTL